MYPTTVDVLAVQVKVAEWVTGVTPVPPSVTVAGEPVALLTMETLPLTVAAVVGLNCTTTVTTCVGVSVTAAPPLVIEKPVPDAVIEEIATFELPVLVIVKLFVVEVPVFTFPKARLVALRDKVCVAATPVPLNETGEGDVGALLTIEMLPETAPVWVGRNATVTVAVAPVFMFKGRVYPLVLNAAPVRLICEMFSVAVPLLVMMRA